jgi:hypothetical protein
MRKVSDKEREKLSAEIAGLESLDLNQLRVQWKLLYEIEAPPHLSRDWLRRAVAYRIQENVLVASSRPPAVSSSASPKMPECGSRPRLFRFEKSGRTQS